MDKGEETADDEMQKTVTFVKRVGDWGHLYGRESCMRCQGNPSECGCLDVNFERKGTGSKREGTGELEFWRTSGTVRLWTR